MTRRIAVLTNAELAEGYMIPKKLTTTQKAEADLQLTKALKKSRVRMYGDTVVALKLYQLKFVLEDYLKQEVFDTTKTFGYFLKEYLHILNIKRIDFANAIQIHETELSNLIAGRRVPNDETMYRLEIQSDNLFPAIYWHKLVDKQKQYAIATNSELKKKQIKFVDKAFIISANETYSMNTSENISKEMKAIENIGKTLKLSHKHKVNLKSPAQKRVVRRKATR